jgi:hypothetical protein
MTSGSDENPSGMIIDSNDDWFSAHIQPDYDLDQAAPASQKSAHNSPNPEQDSLQARVDQYLTKKYEGTNLLFDILSERESLNHSVIPPNWRLLIEDDDIVNPSRAVIQQLAQSAGLSGANFHQANPVRRAHFAVASYFVRVANVLIRDGGKAHSKDKINGLRSAVNDGKILLDIMSKLLRIEAEARAAVDDLD